MVVLLGGKCCCWQVIWEARLPWQPTWQSSICKRIAFTWRCNRTECNWEHGTGSTPRADPAQPSWGVSHGEAAWELPSASVQQFWRGEMLSELPPSPRACGINSLAIAAGGTGNVGQHNLPLHPHPLGARSAVRPCLLSALHCLCQQRGNNWKLRLACALQEPKWKMRIAGCWLFCLQIEWKWLPFFQDGKLIFFELISGNGNILHFIWGPTYMIHASKQKNSETRGESWI